MGATQPTTRHVLTLPPVTMMTRMEIMLPLRIHSKVALLKDQLSDTTMRSVLAPVPVVVQILKDPSPIPTHNSWIEKRMSLLPPLLRVTGKDGPPPLPTLPQQRSRMPPAHSRVRPEISKVRSTGRLEI